MPDKIKSFKIKLHCSNCNFDIVINNNKIIRSEWIHSTDIPYPGASWVRSRTARECSFICTNCKEEVCLEDEVKYD